MYICKNLFFFMFAFLMVYTLNAQITYKINESFEGTFLPTDCTSNSVLGAKTWVQGTDAISNLFAPFPDGTKCATIDYEIQVVMIG